MQDNLEFFRFTDEKLQSLLIKAIRDSGFVVDILDDGTIAYLSENSIENLIDGIVRSIFKNSAYRAEISDLRLSERYKRFKKYNGTQYIEEIRNGKTHFVQEIYQKIYRSEGIATHINFILAGIDLDPDQVTTHIGISPTFACKKDEPFLRPYSGRRKDAPIRLSHKGWWELCSIPHIESNNIKMHIEWIINILEPIAHKLKQFKEQSNEEEFQILQVTIVEPNRYAGISLSGSTLAKLASLTDRIDINFEPDDFI